MSEWTKEDKVRLVPEVNGFEDFPMTENESEVFDMLLQTRLDLETVRELREFDKLRTDKLEIEITCLRGALERIERLISGNIISGQKPWSDFSRQVQNIAREALKEKL